MNDAIKLSSQHALNVSARDLQLCDSVATPRMRTEIYCSANLTLNLRVDSEYVVA